MRTRLAALSCVIALSPFARAQMGPAPVVVSPVVQKEVAGGQTFVGTIKPLRKSLIGSAADGRVETFFVNEGDCVKKGAPLAKLRMRTLELERDAAAKQAVMYQEEHKESKAGSRQQEKDEAKAALAAAEAKHSYVKARYQRTRTLFTTDRTATQEEMQEAQSMFEQTTQEILKARAVHDMVMEGPRREKIAQAKARYESQVDVVNRLPDDQIGLHTIRAPFDGYVVAEHTEEGHWVMKGGPIAEMVELSKVDVEVQVNEDAISHVEIGSEARVEVGALPGRTLIGKVASIVPQANERSRTFPVKIRVENVITNNVPLLQAGMFARATLTVGKRETAVLVSKDAIVLGGPSPMVYVIDADPTDASKSVANPVPVQLGVCDSGLIQVKGSLEPGQKVVVQGNERLRPGQSVVVAKEVDPGYAPQRTVLEK